MPLLYVVAIGVFARRRSSPQIRPDARLALFVFAFRASRVRADAPERMKRG